MSATTQEQGPEDRQPNEADSKDRTETQAGSMPGNPTPGKPGSEKKRAAACPAFMDPEMQREVAKSLGLPVEELAKFLNPDHLKSFPLGTAMGKNARMIMSDGPFNLRAQQEVLQLFDEESGSAPLPAPSQNYQHTSRQRMPYRRSKGLDAEEPTGDIKLTDILGVAFRGIHQEESETSMSDLKRSIEEYGLLHPVIVVRDSICQDKFRLIDGRRRWQAVSALGHRTIRATVRFLETEAEAHVVHLISNCVQKTVSSFELATYCEDLTRTHGIRVTELAQILGYTNAHIYSLLKCLLLPPEILADWKAQHPYLTLRRMIALSRKSDPVPTWIAMRAAFDRTEHHLDDPPADFDEPEAPATQRRPSVARLSKLRDVAANAELPSDPKNFRQVLVEVIDYCRGASADAPPAFAAALPKTRHRRRE